MKTLGMDVTKHAAVRDLLFVLAYLGVKSARGWARGAGDLWQYVGRVG